MARTPRLQRQLESFLPPGIILQTATDAAAVFVVRVIGVGLGFLANVALARWLGLASYGYYSFILAVAAVATTVACLGLPVSILRFLPQYSATGDSGRARGLIRRTAQISIATSSLCAVVLVAYTLSSLETDSSGYLPGLAFGALIVPLGTFLAIQASWLRGLRENLKAVFPDKLLRPATLLALVLTVMSLAARPSTSRAILLVIAALVTAVVAQTFFFRRSTPREISAVEPVFESRTWMRVALPLFMVSGFALILRQVDTLMIAGFLDPEDVGRYSAGARSAELVSFILAAVNVVAPAAISTLHTQARRRDLQRFLTRMAHLSFWPSLAIGLILILGSEVLLSFFGPGFSAAQGAMTVLVIGHLVNAAAGSSGFLLSMTGHQDRVAWTYGWAAVLNITLNYLLIPRFGITGAGIATATSMMFWNIWLLAEGRIRLGLDASILSTLARTQRNTDS
jgi:O-antigen/teichoic acid export membrane protein